METSKWRTQVTPSSRLLLELERHHVGLRRTVKPFNTVIHKKFNPKTGIEHDTDLD
jgi:hypothetical protein